jgi:hypothetical protein
MNRNRQISAWIALMVGAVAASALSATLANAADDQPLVTEEFHHTYPLNAIGRVELQNINGAVHISAGAGNEVKVDAIKRAEDEQELKDEEIRVDASADSISIQTKYHQQEESWQNRHHRGAEVEYTITVPRNARLDEIKLINGELDIIGVSGEVRASCINGKLVARGLERAVKLQTINGPLEADFNQAQATSIELSSVNGPVRLTLPSDAKAHIEATTVHGSIENDFGLHTNNHRWVGHDLNGELGIGGPHIRISNVNRPVNVQHANDGRALSPAKDLGDREKGDDI